MSFLNCFAVKNKLFQQKYPQLCVFFLSGDVWRTWQRRSACACVFLTRQCGVTDTSHRSFALCKMDLWLLREVFIIQSSRSGITTQSRQHEPPQTHVTYIYTVLILSYFDQDKAFSILTTRNNMHPHMHTKRQTKNAFSLCLIAQLKSEDRGEQRFNRHLIKEETRRGSELNRTSLAALI